MRERKFSTRVPLGAPDAFPLVTKVEVGSPFHIAVASTPFTMKTKFRYVEKRAFTFPVSPVRMGVHAVPPER